MEGSEEAVKESEKTEARIWAMKLMSLWEQTEVPIRAIAKLETKSSVQDWDKAFSNENSAALMNAIEPAKELPRPKQRELRKLKGCYTDLLATCLKVGHLYLKSYYAGNLSRFGYSKMIFWTSFANDLLKEFLSGVDKVFHELDASK